MLPRRSTCHKIVKTKGGRYCVVSSLGTRDDTQVIAIDSWTGRLLYSAQPGVDLFRNEADALRTLDHPAILLDCCALVGATVLGGELCLLGACRVKPTMTFPLHHQCYTVTSSKWLRIPLLYPYTPFTREERDKLAAFFEFKLDNLHYYCETYDLSHRFPNANSVEDYDEEFVWNHHMRQAFRDGGLGPWCCVLLQGLAEEAATPDPERQREPAVLGLVTRRSCLNVGARYISRGLNDLHAASNEYECEMLLWIRQTTDTTVLVCWTTYVWIRGTAPVHWKSQMNVGEGEVIVAPDPFKGINHYWGRLQRRYGIFTPFLCISLLRRNPGHGETRLGDTLEASAAAVRSAMAMDLEVRHFDWHQKNRNGIYAAVTELWALVHRAFRRNGVSAGELEFDPLSGAVTQIRHHSSQRGIVRWNCLDSLDRTNLSNFFTAWQVVAEMFRNLGLKHHRASVSPDEPPEPPWPCFSLTVDEVKTYYSADQLSNLAHLFINNGDLCAYLYTASPALHSQYMRAFAVHLPTASPNPVISIVRKFQNFVEDRKRSHQFEILAGRRHGVHFPSTVAADAEARLGGDIHTKHLTGYNTCLLREVPSALPAYIRPEAVLLQPSPVAWVLPRGVGCAEVALLLPAPSQLTELALTVRHGPNDRSSPAYVDVFVGDHADTCLLAWQNLPLPACEDGTALFFPFPPHLSGQRPRIQLYDYGGQASPAFIRFVFLVFHGVSPAVSMTLGTVQLYGFLDTNPDPAPRQTAALLESHSEAVLTDVLAALTSAELPDDPEPLSTSVVAVPSISSSLPGRPPGSADSLDSSSTDSTAPPPAEGAARYIAAVQRTAVGSYPVLGFETALLLEHERLAARLTPWERDIHLVLLDKEVAAFDVNRKVTFRDERVETALRRRAQTPHCSDPVCRGGLMPYKIRRKDTCTYCRLTFCKNCMGSTKIAILEFDWTPTKVCNSCLTRLCTQKKLLTSVTYLSGLQAKAQGRAMALAPFPRRQGGCPWSPLLARGFSDLAGRPYCLTDCATSAIVHSVPTAPDSPPIETILLQDAAQNLRSHPLCPNPPSITADSYWSAPAGLSSAVVTLALPSLSRVVSVVLLTDPLGYDPHDAPSIAVSLGTSLDDLLLAGTWDLGRGLGTSADGPSRIEGDTTHEYILDSNVHAEGARLVSLALSLPDRGADPVDDDPDLAPRLHLGRVMVMGNAVPLPEPAEFDGASSHAVTPPMSPDSGGSPAPSFAASGSTFSIDRWSATRSSLPGHCPAGLLPEDARLYDALLAQGTRPERKVVHSTVVLSKGFADGVVLNLHAPSTVSGFRLEKRVYPEDPNMQVRTLRVLLLQEENGELVAQTVAGEYLTPKVLTTTPLLYEFPEPFAAVSIARFEFLDTYGPDLAREAGSISLFTQTVKPDPPSDDPRRPALHREYCRNTPAHLAALRRQAGTPQVPASPPAPRRASQATAQTSSQPASPLWTAVPLPIPSDDSDDSSDDSDSSPASA